MIWLESSAVILNDISELNYTTEELLPKEIEKYVGKLISPLIRVIECINSSDKIHQLLLNIEPVSVNISEFNASTLI